MNATVISKTMYQMQKGIASMNINECYQAMGADYEEVFGRLRNEKLIAKFVLKFPDDPSFSQLKKQPCRKKYKRSVPCRPHFKRCRTEPGIHPTL